MKKNFIFALCLMSFALAAGAADPWWGDKEVKRISADFDKRKLAYAERIDAMWKRLAEPDFATNEVQRYSGYLAIANWCQCPPWTALKYWEHGLMEKHYPKLMPLVLDSKAFAPGRKVPFVEKNARFLCGHERYDEALSFVRKQRDELLPQMKNPKDIRTLRELEVTVCEWADLFDEGLAAAKAMMKDDPEGGVRCAAKLAEHYDRQDLLRKFTDAMSDETCFDYWGRIHAWRQIVEAPDYVKDRAAACVLDGTKPTKLRLMAMTRILPLDKSPRGLKCMAALKAIPDEEFKKATFNDNFSFKKAFLSCNWRRVVDYYELKLKCGQKPDLAAQRIYVIALANAGEKAKGAAMCDEFAKGEKVSEADRLRFRFYAAMMRGEPIQDILKGCTLPVAEKAKVLQSAGRQAQTMELTEYAEELAKDHAALFTPKPERTLAVRFCEEPIRSIADWRSIHASLPKGYCDLPFGANVQDLVTDVNTQRSIAEQKEGDNLAARMEITAVCDSSALHVFLRVADKGARAVEHRFANGIGTELYFAPGENQPYQCMGTEPLKGLSFVMNTLYDSRRVKRLEKGVDIRSEVAFTDEDYVTHLTFGWDSLYDKLPQSGSYYKFECIAWAPGGGKTWGGSRGIHHSSDWGRLTFALTPAQLTAIRREIVLRNYKTWNSFAITGGSRRLDAFDKWEDDVIGDPRFAATCLKDLQQEMSGYVARVKPDMDDATVDEIYEKAVPTWLGFKHVLDARRKQYLKDELMRE